MEEEGERESRRMIMNRMINKDLIVVGGGPAGCAAAITAARSGASVLVLERGRFPRHRVCGEFVSAESLDLLQDLLAPAHRTLISNAPRIARSRIFVDNAELHAEITPPAASITRFDLDVALWDSCSSAGVERRGDCAVKSVQGTGSFRVTTNVESFEAKTLINATGRWSNLTSTATRARVTKKTKKQKEDRWIGIKAHFRETSAQGSTSPSVDLYFFDGGYCGVQPVSPLGQNDSAAIVNACAVVRADVATDLSEVLNLHPALRERSRNWEPRPPMDPVSTSPLVFHPPEPVQNGMLQVGDAATFVDPFIGDGISLALRSGNLAGECLSRFFRSQCSLESALAEYTSLYQTRLAPIFRASSRLRNLLRWPGVVRKPLLSLLEKTPAITRRFVTMTR